MGIKSFLLWTLRLMVSMTLRIKFRELIPLYNSIFISSILKYKEDRHEDLRVLSPKTETTKEILTT